MSGADDEARLVELQSRLAYQEHTLEALDAVIAEQAARIARLETALERLARRVDAATGAPEAGGDERPPHY